MREIRSGQITESICELCIRANRFLPDDVQKSIKKASETETWPIARDVLSDIQKNLLIAQEYQMPICQDTGMAVVFVELGQEVHIEGDLNTAIQEGVRRGYREGYLRSSVVEDPLRRVNTGDNTPAMIHYEVVPGNHLRLTLVPKGFGSENMSALRMLKPSDGVEGVIDFVLDTVRKAGPNACPPISVGVGIGGTFDTVTLAAKKALILPADGCHPDPFYASLERELLERINQLGIGPQGFGGKNTALSLRILTLPTHIAGLPAAVNIGCHVNRHASEVL